MTLGLSEMMQGRWQLSTCKQKWGCLQAAIVWKPQEPRKDPPKLKVVAPKKGATPLATPTPGAAGRGLGGQAPSIPQAPTVLRPPAGYGRNLLFSVACSVKRHLRCVSGAEVRQSCCPSEACCQSCSSF